MWYKFAQEQNDIQELSKYNSLLILFAAFWGVAGSFLDFWDAFLWIVAFVFIERNVFVWEQELERAAPSGVTQ